MYTPRQIQIIESSIELIADKGIQGFTIKNLSKKIGISEPGIYRHFKNKTAILLSILNNFKEMGEMMNAIIVNKNNKVIDNIDFMFTEMLEIFTDKPAIVSVIFSEEIFNNEPVLKNKIIEIQNMYQLNIETIVAKGQADKTLRPDIDKYSLALILMGALRLLVKRWKLNNHNFNLRSEGEMLINSFKVLIEK